MSTDLEFTKEEIRYPFSRFAQHSADKPPSGINAANGYWVEETHKDPEVGPKTRLGEHTDDFSNLLKIYWGFLEGVETAFSQPNVSADLTDHPTLILPALESYGDDIANVLLDIWTIWKGNADDAKKAKNELIADIKKVLEDVQNDGNLTQGTHANGHIAKFVADAATNAMPLLDAQFPKGTDTDAGRLADSLRVVFVKLSALPTDGYEPWLTAQWQMSFQFICASAAKSLQ